VARFENHDESDFWSFGGNYTMFVSAQGSNKNVAIQMNGGAIAHLAVSTSNIGFDYITATTQPTSKSVTLTDDTVSLYVSTQFYWRSKSTDSDGNAVEYATKSRDINVTLPIMQPYDDGHVIKIKRGVNNGSNVYILPNTTYRRVYEKNSEGKYVWTVKSGKAYILYDSADSTATSLKIESQGNAMELVYHRDLTTVIDNVTYYGCWVQYKCPRAW
jgi:hypothetical protein